MPKVLIAQAYTQGGFTKNGEATYMLLRQHNFPHEYKPDEAILRNTHDVLFEKEPIPFSTCVRKHTGSDIAVLEGWVNKATDEQVMELLKELLRAHASIAWTGYRILGSVNQRTRSIIWTFELFAQKESSDTKVYSGQKAPNVWPELRHF